MSTWHNLANLQGEVGLLRCLQVHWPLDDVDDEHHKWKEAKERKLCIEMRHERQNELVKCFKCQHYLHVKMFPLPFFVAISK